MVGSARLSCRFCNAEPLVLATLVEVLVDGGNNQEAIATAERLSKSHPGIAAETILLLHTLEDGGSIACSRLHKRGPSRESGGREHHSCGPERPLAPPSVYWGTSMQRKRYLRNWSAIGRRSSPAILILGITPSKREVASEKRVSSLGLHGKRADHRCNNNRCSHLLLTPWMPAPSRWLAVGRRGLVGIRAPHCAELERGVPACAKIDQY